MASLPTIITAKKTDSPLILGEGEHKYEVIHNWPQLPDKFTWQTTHDVAFDKAGNLYVIHEGKADQPDHPAIFVFDEELGLLLARAKALGIDLAAMRDAGKVIVEQQDAAELTPGEFSNRVRERIDNERVRIVAIDSLNGYQAAMAEEQFLTLHLHELLQYLNRRGAATFLTIAQHGMMADMKQPIDITYLSDTVIMLRYFEAFGRVRRAMSVMKKRFGGHEDTIREFKIDSNGLIVGDPLHEFQGVLRGVPTYVGQSQPLMDAT